MIHFRIASPTKLVQCNSPALTRATSNLASAAPAHRTAAFSPVIFSRDRQGKERKNKGKRIDKNSFPSLHFFAFLCIYLFCGSVHILFLFCSLASFPFLLYSCSRSLPVSLCLSPALLFSFFLLCLLVLGEYRNNRMSEKVIREKKENTAKQKIKKAREKSGRRKKNKKQ